MPPLRVGQPPTNLTADSTSIWNSAAPARLNSHTYSVGNVISVSDNNRLFFCTASSGATAGSEPGGYSSAVDGGSVTDGSATFRAGCRFSMSTTLSSPQPAMTGPIISRVKMGLPSATIYIDPTITLG